MSARPGPVAVLMGGWSAERPISLLSGACAREALAARGVPAEAVDLRAPEDLAAPGLGRYACAFLALHGAGGEDGTAQQALDRRGLPYTGSGAAASRRCFDKLATKRCWAAAAVPTPPAAELAADADAAAQAGALGLPLMVKPVAQGSSLGAAPVRRMDQLAAAVAQARRYGDRVMLERLVDGREYTVGILDDAALPMIRLRAAGAFFDYRAKYEAADTRYDIPCGLPEAMESELRDLALAAFRSTGASGYGRVDLMLDELDRPWLLEVNTLPGLRRDSLLPKAARAAGIGYEELALRMLATAQAAEAAA